MNHLKKRLEALEKNLVVGAIDLTMQNSTVRRIHGPADLLLNLLGQEIRRGEQEEPSEALRLILEAEKWTEPGGGHLVELIRALAAVPVAELRDNEGSKKEF